MDKFIKLFLFSILLSSSSLINPLRADHVAGTDLSYTCTGTPGVWHITFSFYRTCSGIAVCYPNTCGSSCSRPVSITGADPGCSGISYGTQTLYLTGVRDVNPNPMCPSAKSICNNMGCVTAGTYTPGVERYDFEGDVDLRGLPPNCCNVKISWGECCRSAEISTGSTWQNYYIDCTINRCAAANNPCSSSPILTNDPFAVICGGQPYVFNNGAIDLEGDSLSYAFTPSLQALGQSVTYNAPFAWDAPMPYIGAKNGPFPTGISCDPNTGDIMFTPQYGAGGQFVGVMAVQIYQWRTINGVPTIVGITRRDIQMWLINCPPNTPPRIMTNPSLGNQPKLYWEVCSGNTLCFDVIAKDTDYYPFNSPPISDTTYLKWNQALASFGATFLPKYVPANRKIIGPREDIYQFCWTPTDAMARSLPYYFTVTAKDSRCPNPGTVTRAISVKVLAKADVSIIKNDLKCGKWQVSYFKNKPSQAFSLVTWNVGKTPNDFSGTNVNTYTNVQTTPVLFFAVGGKYLVELNVNTPGPYGVGYCTKQYFDTLTVDTTVAPFVRDTFTCLGSPVTLPYFARWGRPPYSFRWFLSPDTTFPVNAPFFTLTSFTPNPAPVQTTRYTLQVRDLNGCRAYDSNVIVAVKPLPVFLPLDSQRICNGSTYTMNFGNNNGNVKKYKWSTGIAADTNQTLTRNDSGSFILQITDSFYCKNTDTFRLYVNAPIPADAGPDTAICKGDTATLHASGGQLYEWKNLTTGSVIQPKSYNNIVRVNPTAATTKYEVRVFLSYPDTAARNLECSKVDTVIISVNSLPTWTRPQPVQICKSAKLSTINPPIPNQPGGIGIWSYPTAVGAVVAGPSSTQIKTDSLKNLPYDTLNYSSATYFDNWIRYKYTAPASFGGCTNYDSAIVRVFGNPYADAGFHVKWCKNAGIYKLQRDLTRPAPYNVWDRSPFDPLGQGIGEDWTGNGVVKTVVGATTTFKFDPKATGVLTSPAINILTYKFTKQYSGASAPSCSGQDTTTFEVMPVPTVNPGTLNPVCSGDAPFSLSTRSGASTNSGAGGFWTYANVAPLNGINLAMKDSQNFDPSKVTIPVASTQYTWKLYYNDISTGCPIKDSIWIIVALSPSAKFTFDVNGKDTLTVCRNSGNSLLSTLVNPLGGIGAYVSKPSTSAFASDPSDPTKAIFNANDASLNVGNGKHTYSLIYNYTINVPASTVTCATADTTNITVEEPPTLTILTKLLEKCADDSVFGPLGLVVSDAGTYTTNWKHFGNGHWQNPNDTTKQLIYYIRDTSDIGAIYIGIKAYTLKNNTCPIAEDTATLQIDPKPVAEISCIDCEGCEPLNPVLIPKPNTIKVTYVWSVDGVIKPTADTLKINIPRYGAHTAILGVTTPAGCTVISKPKNIKVYATPVAMFEPSPEVTTVARPYFDFINQSSTPDGTNISKCLWNFGPETTGGQDRTSTDCNPKGINFASETGVKPIKLQVTTEYGCVNEFTKSVTINPDITVFIPNAFYPGTDLDGKKTPCPNGDMECNSTFKPAAKGFQTIEIFVFNRWGQQVYHRIFGANDLIEGWNGRINNNGIECQQDVYIYQINATSYSSKTYKYSGSVTLMR